MTKKKNKILSWNEGGQKVIISEIRVENNNRRNSEARNILGCKLTRIMHIYGLIYVYTNTHTLYMKAAKS